MYVRQSRELRNLIDSVSCTHMSRFLSSEAPRLPLTNCSMSAECVARLRTTTTVAACRDALRISGVRGVAVTAERNLNYWSNLTLLPA
jgi:hypothetical protein